MDDRRVGRVVHRRRQRMRRGDGGAAVLDEPRRAVHQHPGRLPGEFPPQLRSGFAMEPLREENDESLPFVLCSAATAPSGGPETGSTATTSTSAS